MFKLKKSSTHQEQQLEQMVQQVQQVQQVRQRLQQLEQLEQQKQQKQRQRARVAALWIRRLASLCCWNFFSSKEPKVAKPPGIHLLRIAELLVSKKRYEKACVTTVADWHEEYFEALDQKRAWPKFLFIRIRYTWAFAKSLLLLGVLAALGKLLKSVFSGK